MSTKLQLMKEKPYWYKVLNHFESRRYFRNGLTIPYLIGSRLHVEPKERMHTINHIINEINDSSFYVSVLKCEYIGEFVFSLCNQSDKVIYGGLDNFVFVDSSFEKAVTLLDIIQELETKYSDCIASGLFSKIHGKWREFSELDKSRLSELFTS